ncbi:MAG: ABC transporter substrate-binding protein [Neisseriaceae bacterium]|nr:ABC transporter substrate-binding protein [Neisseriaceae bacterium]
MNAFKKSILTAATLLCCSVAFAAPADAVNQIKTNSVEILKILNKENGANAEAVKAEAERYASPYFDFERMTALAVGQPWKQASAEQKKQLTEAFKNKLIRIYSGTMFQYKSAKVTVNDKPRVENNGKQVIINTEVLPSANSPKSEIVHIDYTTYQSGDKYRIYDVKVEGQSLVTVYRTQFKEIVNKSGIDGLIAELKKEGGK